VLLPLHEVDKYFFEIRLADLDIVDMGTACPYPLEQWLDLADIVERKYIPTLIRLLRRC
jgi:hypothetical protein